MAWLWLQQDARWIRLRHPQPLDGDKRWVSWFAAPAGTEQHLAGVATNAQGGVIADITVDSSATPDLAAWGKRAGELCAEWYPKIATLLASEGFVPPKHVHLIFQEKKEGVADTSGDTINMETNHQLPRPCWRKLFRDSVGNEPSLLLPPRKMKRSAGGHSPAAFRQPESRRTLRHSNAHTSVAIQQKLLVGAMDFHKEE